MADNIFLGTDAAPTVTFSPDGSDSLLIFVWGQITNSTLTSYGTGQVSRGEFAQGGAEKNSAGNSSEIITAGGSNDQSAVISKSAAWLAAVIEINAEAVGTVAKFINQDGASVD